MAERSHKYDVGNQPFHKVMQYGLYSRQERDGTTKYVCNLCAKKYVILDSLINHLKTVHANEPLPNVKPYE
jgi:hypothetical protein